MRQELRGLQLKGSLRGSSERGPRLRSPSATRCGWLYRSTSSDCLPARCPSAATTACPRAVQLIGARLPGRTSWLEAAQAVEDWAPRLMPIRPRVAVGV
jgi:hypothetical protein